MTNDRRSPSGLVVLGASPCIILCTLPKCLADGSIGCRLSLDLIRVTNGCNVLTRGMHIHGSKALRFAAGPLRLFNGSPGCWWRAAEKGSSKCGTLCTQDLPVLQRSQLRQQTHSGAQGLRDQP